LAFGCASYIVGSKDIITGKYKPSIFSRVVWLLLAGISFAGVVASHGGFASIMLSAIFLGGNAAICLLSFWKGTKGFGRLEYVCLAILVLSGVVWIVFKAPLISLAISLLAHFVGGAPTYRTVWRDPSSESAGFWSLFFIASALSLLAGLGQPWQSLIFPAYFTLFDGGMTFLSLRRTRPGSLGTEPDPSTS
jgi:hypothetical protein